MVEDTDYTVEDIRALFGDKIAQIVDGLTKISSGMFGENVSAQAENFRKLLLTMSDDIRVILIKIADRLHNMRTLSSMSPTKQFKITGETLYIYARWHTGWGCLPSRPNWKSFASNMSILNHLPTSRERLKRRHPNGIRFMSILPCR